MTETRFIDIDCIGESTGTRYVGTFEVQLFLTLGDRMEVARMRSKVLRDISETDDLFYLLQLTVNLGAHLKGKLPSWWGEDGMSLRDSEPIMALAKSLREEQKRFADTMNPKEKASGSDNKDQ